MFWVQEGSEGLLAVQALVDRHLAAAPEGGRPVGTVRVGPDEVDELRAFHRIRVAQGMAAGRPVPDGVRRAYEAHGELDAVESYPVETGWSP